MVTTRWKKYIERAGRAQRSLAQALSVNQAELSMVVQGRAFLTPEKFKRACELLDCNATDIYPMEVVSLMYGEAPSRQTKRDTRVRLDDDVLERVDFVADDEHLSRAQAANAIIRRAFETRRIEHV
jgi:transcriptional regulator with XRE-family HTH domain